MLPVVGSYSFAQSLTPQLGFCSTDLHQVRAGVQNPVGKQEKSVQHPLMLHPGMQALASVTNGSVLETGQPAGYI